MAGFKHWMFKYARHLASAMPLSQMIRASRKAHIGVFYHTVSDEPLPHIQHLYTPKNVKAFESDLETLLKYYNPVELSKHLQCLQNRERSGKPTFHLSFDDGLQEFATVIAPILLKKGIPATCFVNSGFVDNQDLFYRYKASLLIDAFYQNPNTEVSEASTHSLSDFRKYILSLKHDDNNIINKIAKKMQIDFNEFLSNQKPYLTIEQMNSLQKQGFTFGAHSVNHPLYKDLSLQEQLAQTQDSLEWLQEHIHPQHRVFSFPFTDYGVNKSFFRHMEGQDIMEASFGSAGLKDEHLKRHHQRIALESQELNAKQILSTEYLYYLLKLMVGKNYTQRND